MINLFGKNAESTLTIDDLKKILDGKISEGLFVEFKREFPATSKVAKGISALANTHGGYFIVGVEATPEGIACKADGYDSSGCQDPIAFVRNACRDYLSPFPNFSHRLVDVSEGKRVSIIRVPSGEDGAHIHQDGRVYIRKADSSDPVHLTDRLTLDRIYEKQERSANAFKEFAKDGRVQVSGASWLNIFISPRPLKSVSVSFGHTLADYERILKDVSASMPVDIFTELHGEDSVSANVDFRRIYRSGDSICIEQTFDGSVIDCLTMCVDNMARASIHIPINIFKINDESLVIKSEKVLKKLNELSGKVGIVVKYYNAAELWQLSMHMLHIYSKLINSVNAQNGYQFSVELVNAQFCTPFVDDDKWCDALDRIGLPVCRHKLVRIPSDTSRSVYVESYDELGDELRAAVIDIIGLPDEIIVTGMIRQVFDSSDQQSGSVEANDQSHAASENV